ncbi:hypothetical protein LXA43DRAFT_1114871 [Ganoderma leucocontextum]|nr:hypothetical protein LXA43DRAFT_1159750 [Ganoderma leucocontextum]KAI1794736.1 hypothetical protein LXA43DRAFT_1114871 [Ganoderma leucocontextum]
MSDAAGPSTLPSTKNATKPRKRFVGSKSATPSKPGYTPTIANQIPPDILNDAQQTTLVWRRTSFFVRKPGNELSPSRSSAGSHSTSAFAAKSSMNVATFIISATQPLATSTSQDQQMRGEEDRHKERQENEGSKIVRTMEGKWTVNILV